MKTFRIVTLVLCLTLACALTSIADSDAPIRVIDMAGREIVLDQAVTRVVALSAADCEILYALSAGDTLVGRGMYCDYPEQISIVPIVQSGYETNIEQIIELEPQLVIMSKMAQTKEQVEALEKSGIRVVVSDAQDIEGVYAAIELIGTLVDRETEADAVIQNMRQGFAEIAELAKDKGGKSVYFEVSPLEYGLWTAGSATFMHELAAMTGLRNIFEDVVGWSEISEEQVIARNPDFIVTITMYFGEGIAPVDEILAREGWSEIEAVKNLDVLNADSNEMSRPGPRLLDAARSLYEFVYGEPVNDDIE